MYKSTLTFLLICYSWLAPAQKASLKSAVLPEVKPESEGFSTEKLAELDKTLEAYTQNTSVPGTIALIMRNGKIVHYKANGFNDLTAKTPLRRDAIVRIASQTKAITSIGLMLLYEEGKFQLDDPVSKYIPAFRHPRVLDKFNARDSSFTTIAAKSEITIRHLLTHTSGISYPTIGTQEARAFYAKNKIPSGIGTPTGKLADAMLALAKMPLIHQPGERWTYGLNTDLVGYLIEVLSGQPLDKFLQARIFKPLGMQDTYFYLPIQKQDRLALLYTEDAQRNTVKMPLRPGQDPDYPKGKGTYFSGGAGLSSTITDYAIFLQMILNKGEYMGTRILKPATVELITKNQIGEINNGNNKFGLGFGIITEKEAARLPLSVGSLDWGGIFGTRYWIDPKTGIIALLYTQKYPNSYYDLGDKFKIGVYEAFIKKAKK